VARIANFIPEAEVKGAQSGKLLILSWGGTHGSIAAAVEKCEAAGKSVGWVHLRHINPMPKNLGDIIKKFDKVLVPELNLGQLVKLVRDRYVVPAIAMNKVQGRPFMTSEIVAAIEKELA